MQTPLFINLVNCCGSQGIGCIKGSVTLWEKQLWTIYWGECAFADVTHTKYHHKWLHARVEVQTNVTQNNNRLGKSAKSKNEVCRVCCWIIANTKQNRCVSEQGQREWGEFYQPGGPGEPLLDLWSVLLAFQNSWHHNVSSTHNITLYYWCSGARLGYVY